MGKGSRGEEAEPRRKHARGWSPCYRDNTERRTERGRVDCSGKFSNSSSRLAAIAAGSASGVCCFMKTDG